MPDELYFAAEILLIAGLALERLDYCSSCQVIVDELRHVLGESPPGLLDRWARPQADGLLGRWPISGVRRPTFDDVRVLLEHVLERALPQRAALA